ncbi:hypothetical protein DFH08DRAFT_247290 [Mycena albidolilacea]|uniref:Uncharacterized protein n=1 Tax=Mycena albidolilacea TaxID=1033008 RepID=A0AAD6ZUN4_9AGAR|nr:hypothetical protein DFH08DRAFT_247290 [Mycena albidolilacea]
MQIHSVVLAIALSFASLAAGQSPEFPTDPSGSNGNVPVTGSSSPTANPAGVPASATAWAVSYYPPYYDNGVSKRTVAAAIGGSFAASLFVLIGAIFLMRYRARKMMVIAVEGGNADLGSRCDRLESEVRGLREQLGSFQTQRLSGAYGSRAVLYTHEKDAEAMLEYGKVKGEKEGPPMYAD